MSSSASYKVGSISDLFSKSLPDPSAGNLTNLFSQQNQDKFKRAIKPKEFEQKKKVEIDERGNRKDIKKNKKPKHPKKSKDEIEQRPPPIPVNANEANAKTIFVGNIPLTETVKSLKRYFKEFGEVDSLRLRSVPIAGLWISTPPAPDPPLHAPALPLLPLPLPPPPPPPPQHTYTHMHIINMSLI